MNIMPFSSIRYLSLVGLSLSLVAQTALADGKRDYYFQQALQRYMNLPQNARTMGMGGSSVVTSQDSSSVVGNPAGIGLMQEGDTSVSYDRNSFKGRENPNYKLIKQRSDNGQALVTIPLGLQSNDLPQFGSLGLGWSGYNGNTNDSLDTGSDGHRINFAYGKALSSSLALGYGLSYFDDKLQNNLSKYSSKQLFRHTFGIQESLGHDWTWGGTVFYGSGKDNVEVASIPNIKDSKAKEYGAELGTSWNWLSTTMAVSADYEHYRTNGSLNSAPPEIVIGGDEHGKVFNLRIGAERSLTTWLVGRVGYHFGGLDDYHFSRSELADLNGSAKYNAWNFGIGTIIPTHNSWIKAVKLDYGAEYRAGGTDSWEHLVTLSIPWGGCDEELKS